MKAILLTNNQSAVEFIENSEIENIRVYYLNTKEIKAILSRARDMIHEGHKLLTHPLSGSVKPYETPYKSILLSNEKKQEVNIESLKIIEDAILLSENFAKNNKLKYYSEKIHEDLRLIDLELIKSGIDSFRR